MQSKQSQSTLAPYIDELKERIKRLESRRISEISELDRTLFQFSLAAIGFQVGYLRIAETTWGWASLTCILSVVCFVVVVILYISLLMKKIEFCGAEIDKELATADQWLPGCYGSNIQPLAITLFNLDDIMQRARTSSAWFERSFYLGLGFFLLSGVLSIG